MYTTLIVIFYSTGARSEALASLLLELHGLQDMLEGLCEWVAGAEATMATTEASPVGNDMETVERQLAEHEVLYSTHIQIFWIIILSLICIIITFSHYGIFYII